MTTKLNCSSINFIEPNILRATYKNDNNEVVVDRVIDNVQDRKYVHQTMWHSLGEAEFGFFGDVDEKILNMLFDSCIEQAPSKR